MKARRTVPLLIAFGVVLLTPPPARGQGAYLGARVGISVTDYSLPYLSEDWQSGMVAGAFAAFPLRDHVSLEPEVSWVRKGADWFREGIGPTRAELDYLATGVLARLSLPLVRGLSLSVHGGPWVGILAKCGTTTGESTDCDSLFRDDDHRSLDVGWDLGAGAAVQAGRVLTRLDVRRSRGLTRLLEDRPRDNPTTESTQLTVGVGYRVR